MCGIAGHYGPQNIPEPAITDCLQRLQHRGPDHAGFKTWDRAGINATLLFTRLSIIDRDARANQPMRFRHWWLTFNGELYNYRELREELAGIGHSFVTTSDSEVLLHAIAEWGLTVIDRFEGMWAFALYDERDGSLTLSRDRFGEKPLYLLRGGSDLYYGSEIKCLAALSLRKLPVNLGQVTRYLMNGYKALYKSGETFFEGVTEVPAGTVMHLSLDGSIECERYWTPRFAPNEEMTYDEAVAGARDRLLHSVELRLRADVPLAFCMSGGVDSNAIIAIAKRVFGYDVHGFTIVNTDSRYEEQDLVNHVVEALDLRHTSVPVRTEGFLPKLRNLVRAHDAPVITITYYAHWLLQESIANHGYRVSVSGTAADEMFSGYFDHHLQYLYGLRDRPDLLAPAREAWLKHIQPHVRNPFLREWDVFYKNPGFRDHIFVDGPRFDHLLKRPWHEDFGEAAFTDDLLRNRMLNELTQEAVPVILHEDDLNAMYFSIENRSPFLDRDLFEFCYSIPSRHLIRDGAAKAILRDAMRGIVPDPVLDSRRKVGFNAPVFSFLDVHDPGVRAWLTSDSPIYDLIDPAGIEALIAKSHLDNHESKFLFYFVSSKLFLEEFA
jgi:asparagine synthase (glutamine-hydrolysing)